jgi:hypothetical protein
MVVVQHFFLFPEFPIAFSIVKHEVRGWMEEKEGKKKEKKTKCNAFQHFTHNCIASFTSNMFLQPVNKRNAEESVWTYNACAF